MNFLLNSRIVYINHRIFDDHDYTVPESKHVLIPHNAKAISMERSETVNIASSVIVQESLLHPSLKETGTYK